MKVSLFPSVLILLPLMTLSPVARADHAYDDCIERSDGTNTAWGECGWTWVAREDARLNAAWKRIYGQTEGQTKVDLLAEQRVWIKYREKACAYYGNGDFGREGQVISFPGCVAEVIAARTKQLEDFGAR